MLERRAPASAASKFLKTCSVCAPMSPLPTIVPDASPESIAPV
jgi:hypothetical protein